VASCCGDSATDAVSDLANALLRPLALALVALALALVLLKAVPGVEEGLVGRHANAAERAAVRERLGLDQPVLLQWWRTLGAYAWGDLGRSWVDGQQVGEVLAQRLPVSLVLLLPGFVLGHLLALWLATWRRAWLANAISALSVACGVVLLALASRHLLAPAFGLPVRDLPLAPWGATFLHLLLPTVVLAASGVGLHYLRYRSRYQQALDSAFALASVARGERGGARRAALRDLRGLLLSRLLYDFPLVLLGGAVLETLFAVPGLGARLVPAVLAGDQPVVLAVVLLGGLLFALLRGLLALVLLRVDPRMVQAHG
jgi:peptide/nickel transport system permease protein